MVDTIKVDSPQSDEARATTTRLREQTAAVRDDVRELGRLTREVSHEKIEQAKHAATDYLDKGRKKAARLLKRTEMAW